MPFSLGMQQQLRCRDESFRSFRDVSLLAQQAMSADQDFRDFTDRSHRLHGRFRQFELMQAGHAATVDTNEMRMLTTIRMRIVSQLKAPDVIAQFFSSHEACFNKIGEIPQHSRFIEAKRDQARRNIRMRRG